MRPLLRWMERNPGLLAAGVAVLLLWHFLRLQGAAPPPPLPNQLTGEGLPAGAANVTPIDLARWHDQIMQEIGVTFGQKPSGMPTATGPQGGLS